MRTTYWHILNGCNWLQHRWKGSTRRNNKIKIDFWHNGFRRFSQFPSFVVYFVGPWSVSEELRRLPLLKALVRTLSITCFAQTFAECMGGKSMVETEVIKFSFALNGTYLVWIAIYCSTFVLNKKNRFKLQIRVPTVDWGWWALWKAQHRRCGLLESDGVVCNAWKNRSKAR